MEYLSTQSMQTMQYLPQLMQYLPQLDRKVIRRAAAWIVAIATSTIAVFVYA